METAAKKVRVLHVLAPDVPTGTAKQMRFLHEADAGSRVITTDPDQRRRARLPQFSNPPTICPLRSALDVSFLLRWRQLQRRWQPELVHVWGEGPRSLVRFLAMAKGAARLCVSVRSFLSQRGVTEIDPWARSRVDQFVCNHIALETSLVSGGVPSAHVANISNGVRRPSLTTVRPLHQKLGVGAEVQFVAVVGDLREHKQVQDLIWAMDLLRVIHPSMHLVIVGEGGMRERLAEFERQVNLQRCVHFLGAIEDVTPVLSQCFCLWQAGRDEGSSNALLEAMAAGLPVVATDALAHRALLETGVHGFLVPPGDSAEFARKTNQLLEDAKLARRMGDAGAQRAQQDFAAGAMVDAYFDLYRQRGLVRAA